MWISDLVEARKSNPNNFPHQFLSQWAKWLPLENYWSELIYMFSLNWATLLCQNCFRFFHDMNRSLFSTEHPLPNTILSSAHFPVVTLVYFTDYVFSRARSNPWVSSELQCKRINYVAVFRWELCHFRRKFSLSALPASL